MSFHALSERLSALQDSNAQLKDLIDRLASLKFQPGSIALDDAEDGNAMTELTSEIQQMIKEQEEDFGLLQEEVYDLEDGGKGKEGEDQRSGLVEAVRTAVKALKAYETAFRKAQLTARRTLQAAQKQERELLLQSYVEPRSPTASPLPDQQQRQQRSQKPKTLTQEEKELNASSEFTLALRRTHESMAAELSRSQFAHDTLKESTAALESLSDTYSTLDTMLSSSKNLLGTLLKSQKSDTWYLETAFYILLATIAWLFWRRVLYGPTWWLLWFPLKMFIKGWVGVFDSMGLGAASEVALSSLASPVAAATSIAASSVVHRKATRELKVPGAAPPIVNVEGGGRGAPMKGPNVPGAVQLDGEESISEQVGRITEDNRDGEAVMEESAEDVSEAGDQPNPKKRMWEEERKTQKAEIRSKEEL